MKKLGSKFGVIIFILFSLNFLLPQRCLCEEQKCEDHPDKITNEFQVNDYIEDTQDSPKMVVFPERNDILVAWRSWNRDGCVAGLYGRILNEKGEAIGDEYQLSDSFVGCQYADLTVGVINETHFIVAYTKAVNEDTNLGIYISLYEHKRDESNVSGGQIMKVGNEFQITNTISKYQQTTQKNLVNCILNAEHIMIVWELYNDNNYQIRGQLLAINADTMGTFFKKISSEIEINDFVQNKELFPDITKTNQDGEKFIIVYQKNLDEISSHTNSNVNNNMNNIYFQNFQILPNEEGIEKIGTPVQVNTQNLNQYSEDSPKATSFLNYQYFIIVYQTSPSTIYAQIYDSTDASKVGEEFIINDLSNTFSKVSPSVSEFSNNNNDYNSFTVIWSSNEEDGSSGGLFGQLFHFNPQTDASNQMKKIGKQFRINNETFDDQKNGLVKNIDNENNDFVVVWTSKSQDGSGDGIFGQILNANNVNIPPLLNKSESLADHLVFKNQQFVYQFSKNLFIDPNNENLAFSSHLISQNLDMPSSSSSSSSSSSVSPSFSSTVARSKNSNLPDWLTFDSTNRRFSGIVPSNNCEESIQIEVIGKDICNQAVSDDFSITFNEINQKPYLNKKLENQIILNLEKFSYQFDQNTFLDPDNDRLDYNATLLNNSKLPDWLSFDSNDRTFEGVHPDLNDNDDKIIKIKIVAFDKCNNQVSGNFELTVLNSNQTPVIAIFISIAIFLMACICFFTCFRRRRRKITRENNDFIDNYGLKETNKDSSEMGSTLSLDHDNDNIPLMDRNDIDKTDIMGIRGTNQDNIVPQSRKFDSNQFPKNFHNTENYIEYLNRTRLDSILPNNTNQNTGPYRNTNMNTNMNNNTNRNLTSNIAFNYNYISNSNNNRLNINSDHKFSGPIQLEKSRKN
ncbi:dystroglycan-related [Anaeramoeba flamelloides]|uniref:Dystroglycan-related n=1 Tax=Anaeramoeba flamelloides TaxID=1746091 RepID=A0AAV7ZI16_9EUKA|nr:dystroglycan-related [Anaeramoeba flamelloides]